MAAPQQNRLARYFRNNLPTTTTADLVGISVRQVDPNDLSVWQALIKAPEDSIYEGGKYYLKIVFGYNTPFMPPNIFFQTPIHHQEVLKDDYIHYGVCLNIFMLNKWSPAYRLRDILVAIRQLLRDSNIEHPLSCLTSVDYSVSELYHTDKAAYAASMRQHVTTHAINNYERYSLIAGHTLPRPSEPATLVETCRTAIRFRLRGLTYLDIDDLIQRLPLPECLLELLKSRTETPSFPGVDKIIRIQDPKWKHGAARLQERIDAGEI